VRIANTEIQFWDQMREALSAHAGQQVELELIRAGQPVVLDVPVPEDGILGFLINRDLSIPRHTVHYGFFESFPIGAGKAWGTVVDNAKGLGKIFKGEVRADKALSGPIGIAQLFGDQVDWVRFWTLVGLLSMVLALMNLLPIPALDGGHVVFLLIEMIQGKPLSEKVLETAQMIGFFILLAFVVFGFGNDIFELLK